ncbi:hypothetical protein SCLCIDRAFT_13135 [Scleroderma citrinum Foug A]|uniref:DASH complex subunit DUO1 n=1 Tax=Scleroderma citrinum Foug A TaxID=1036808 RepID=A0A0C3A7T0_9AGAM|nr:hypothetical protein SCLCIDRAFT_13135 [Scleroderma citrinum Foug A]
MASWSLSTPSSSLPVVDDIGSRILSESFPSPDPVDDSFHLQDTGPGGADLSLSELSLSDKPFTRDDGPRFSLLAPQPALSHPFSSDQSAIAEDDEYDDDTGATADTEEDVTNTAVIGRAVTAKAREEKLQRDLFILKKLNSSFSVLNDALSVAKSATEQVAEQLVQTDGLLDKYANMLSKSEGVTRLIFDEQWEGAEADEEAIARERAEAIERARIEHERAEAARREEEERRRREAEEAARREEEERVRKDAAAAATATTNKPAPRGRGTGASMNSGVRGVRGTRASAAAMAARSGGRGIPRGAGVSTTTRTHSTSATGSVTSSTGRIPRPSSAANKISGVPRGVARKG